MNRQVLNRVGHVAFAGAILVQGCSSSSAPIATKDAGPDDVTASGDASSGNDVAVGGNDAGADTNPDGERDAGTDAHTGGNDAGGPLDAQTDAPGPTGCTGDGSGDAPVVSGGPQLPNLLTGYMVRSPCRVAGVDYAVGYPSSTVLKDPATISVSGVSVNANVHQIVVTSDGVTLDGYDFSLEGGWQVIVEAPNATIKNSSFKIGTNGNALINGTGAASNLTIAYCVLDGAGLADNLNGALIDMNGVGMLLEYSWLKNGFGDFIDVGNGGAIVVQYNLLENDGQGADTHPDWLQLGGQGAYGISLLYNTVYQIAAPSGAPGTQGLMMGGYNSASLSSAEAAFNTIVTLAGARVNFILSVETTELTGTATVHDNYADPTGNDNAFATSGSTSATSTFAHNLNMVTGMAFPTVW